MNPLNKEVPDIQLGPGPEQASPSNGDDPSEGLRAGSERPAGAERSFGPPSAPLAGGLPTIPLPEPPQILSVSPTALSEDAGAAAAQGSTLTAGDNDLIEKEWVNKAKQIVERTRDDPYKQSEDLTLFKADYIKKRYGKTIKVSQ